MSAESKAASVVNILMNAGSKISGLLSDTSTDDVPGRDLRLIDQLIGMSVQSIRIALRCGANEQKVTAGNEQNTGSACGHLDDLQRWLRDHPAYMSQTSDGSKGSGRPVDGQAIREVVSAVDRLLSVIIPGRHTELG